MPDPTDTETLVEVRLTDAEREALRRELDTREGSPRHRQMIAHIERIVAARIVQARAGEGALPQPPEQPLRSWCSDCGPGYRLGDEGCRHGTFTPTVGDTGICRTCAQPIWWETGEVGHREHLGWSDRFERGGDSLVCFKAVGYRHVPMGAREAAIYHAGRRAALATADPS